MSRLEMHDDDGVLYVSHSYLGYSDYSDCSACRANVEILKDREDVILRYGGHGTVQLWIQADSPDTEDILDSLDNYLVLDEGKMSEIEDELEREAFDSWARADLVRSIKRDYLREWADNVDGEVLWEIYLDCDRSYNHMESTGYWIAVKKITEEFEKRCESIAPTPFAPALLGDTTLPFSKEEMKEFLAQYGAVTEVVPGRHIAQLYLSKTRGDNGCAPEGERPFLCAVCFEDGWRANIFSGGLIGESTADIVSAVQRYLSIIGKIG